MEQAFKKDIEVYRVTKNFRRCLRWMINKGMNPESRYCPCCQKGMSCPLYTSDAAHELTG